MLVPAVGEAMTAIEATLASLTKDVTTLIPAALGVAVIVFGAIFLWGTAKRLVS